MGVPKEAWLGALERWMETDTWKIALEEEQTARVAARAQENNGRLKTREEIWDADVFMRMADPRVIVELLPSQTDESLFGKVRHRLANAELSAEDIAVCMRLKLVLSYKMPGDDPDHVAVIFSGEMGRFANAAENVKAVITWIEGDRVATTADEWKKRGVTKENLNMAKQFPDFAEQYGSKGTRKRVKMAKGSASEPLPPPSPAGSEPLLPAAVGAAEPHVLPAVNVVDPVLAQGFSVDLAAVDPNGPAVEAVGAPLEDPTVPAAPSSPLGMSKLVKQGLIPTLSNTNKSNVQSSFKIAFYNVGDLTLGFPADRYRKWKESIEWGQRQAAISERLHRERDEKEAKANARRKAESKPPPKSKVQVTHRHVFREIADVRVDVEILPQTSADSYFYKLRHAMAVLPGLHTAQRDVLNQLKLTLRMKMPDNMPPVTVACRYDEERIRLKPETLQRIANMLLDSLGIPLPAAAASAPAASTETAAAAVPAASVAPTKPAVVEVSVAIPAPTRAPSSAAPKSLPTSQNFQQRKLFDAPLAATAPPRPKASAQAAPSAKPAKQQVKLSFAKTDAVSKKGPKTPEPTVPTRTQYSEMPQTAPALHTSSGVDLATETELGPVNETVLAEAIKDYRFDGDEAAMAAAADEIEMALEAALRHVDDPMMVDD
ncbi:hypothetical protein DFJ74DRAFT_660343 [Hyaloraphidium curvatum]|nr:hypothetical protein DFJ74DRAFT_660343 [Hyaloraphidium curvatum]